MISRILKTRLARYLVYLLCTLMLLGGQPLMALQENVQIVPREDRPEWLEPWLQGETYSDAWTGAGRFTGDSAAPLLRSVGTWRDRALAPAWDLLETSWAVPAGPRRAAAGTPSAPGQVPVFTAAFLGQVDETTKDTEAADELAGPRTITKAEPLPSAPGLKIGHSDFQPPKELLQQLTAKADLDQIPLVPGWNLLSIPEEPADSDPAAVLAPIAGAYTRVYAFDNCDPSGTWQVYDPSDAAATNLTSLDHSQGFWIEGTTPVDLPSDGNLPASSTIQLCPGWNLIGYPAAQPRHVSNALHTIEGKYIRVFGFDASDADDPWEVHSVGMPSWANDLQQMVPGRGYWVLATEATELTIANEGPDPIVDITAPDDLSVVTDFTDIVGTVESPILESWRLTFERVGETGPVEIASGVAPVTEGVLGTFDPTLLINGLYELKLEATDLDGRIVEDTIAVPVEGNMKIGHFTLSFVDLAIPLSGLDIEIVRTYDSRRKDELLDFGHGWSLDIRQGSYQNNRPPGDGWKIVNPGGPFGLPCSQTVESKSHLTTVRLSDQEVYRFRLALIDPATVIGGCYARAQFQWVDGPLPGTTLEILGNDEVIYQGDSNGDFVIDSDTFETFVPNEVKLTTRDGRIFHLNLSTGVTHLEDLNGNAVEISADGITHSSGVGIDFVRDGEGRIQEIVDLRGNSNLYNYSAAGDLVRHTDRAGGKTQFAYREHYLEDIHNALGVRAVRNEYDADGRLVRHIDAQGNAIELSHDLAERQEVVTNRLGQSRLLKYDARGNVVREVDEVGAVTERTYDAEDNLLTEKDPLGRLTTYTYTATGDLASVADALGNTTRFTYGDRGQILTLTDPGGNVTTSSYDAAGNLLSTTDALDQVTTFAYNSGGQLVSSTDALGQTTQFAYSARGDLLTDTDPLGNVTSYSYGTGGNRLSETRSRTLPDGSSETIVTSFAYDELDRVVATTAADGTVNRATHDALGRATSQADQLGRVTTMDYDPIGRLVQTTFPDGTSQLQSYDAEGRTLTQTDRAGRVTQMAYDPAGRLLSTTFADGATHSQSYDAAGQLASTTDAVGTTTAYTFDDAGRRTQVTNALGQSTSFGYDSRGNQTSVTDARGNTTEFSFDALGRLTTITYADATTTEVGYDALGRRVRETDQLGVSTQFDFDVLGQLTSVTDALDQVTRYTYDEVGNHLTQTDANGQTTSFEYDSLGRKVARILPDDARETMSYNDDGTLASHTDFNGETRTFEYDENQRIIRRAYLDGTQHLFSYTATGQRETATDSRGITTYVYDARDRVLEKQDPSGHRLTYTYDPQGNLESLTATAGTESYTTSYGHDELNRLKTITDPQDGVSSHTYDLNGNRASLTHANGLITTYDYDPLNRLTLLETRDASSNVVQSYAYTLRPTGHRTRVEEADGTVRSYSYDSLYRLTQDRVRSPAGESEYQHDFAYDAVGNRLSQTIDEGEGPLVVSSTYDERDRLLTAGDAALGWDANGSLTGRDADVLRWGADQHLTSVTLEGGTVLEMVYDVDGNRVQTRVTPQEGPTTTIEYLVDTRSFLSHVVTETVNGSIETVFVRSDDELVSLYRPADEESRYYHADGLASIRALSNEVGEVTDRYAFSAFGQSLQHDGEDPNVYLFAGESVDLNSGFYYNRARWMYPATGRFVSTDPIGGFPRIPSSLHRYVYAESDPAGRVDPTGEWSMGATLVAASVGGIVGAIDAHFSGNNPAIGFAVAFAVTAVAAPLVAALAAKSAIAAGGIAATGYFFGGFGVGVAIHEGNIELAVFRGATLVFGTGLISRLSRAVPASFGRLRLIGTDQRLGQAARLIKPEPGKLDVIVHGGPDSVAVQRGGEWVEMSHRSLAAFIRRHGPRGLPQVRLLSCKTGSCPTGFARNLANKLGVDVEAPSDTLWIHPNGRLTIGPTEKVNTGAWIRFSPGNGGGW